MEGPNRAPSLFYSKFCRHCSDLLLEYGETASSAGVVFVCVDTCLYELPPIISKVPALVVPSEKTVLFWQDLRCKLNEIISSHSSVPAGPVDPVEAQGNAMEIYSFLAPGNDSGQQKFADPFADEATFTSLSASSDSETSKKVSVSLDSLAAQRDADVAHILANQKALP